jgi:hypothetical protein
MGKLALANAVIEYDEQIVPSLVFTGQRPIVRRVEFQRPGCVRVSLSGGLSRPEPWQVDKSWQPSATSSVVASPAGLSLHWAALAHETVEQPVQIVAVDAASGESMAGNATLFPLWAWSPAVSYFAATACFVRENSAAVESVLELAGLSPTAGASSDEAARRLYEALLGLDPVFRFEPQLYNAASGVLQMIRSPRQVLNYSGAAGGVCIDLACLVAACLMAAGHQPLVTLTKLSPGDNHAMVAWWVAETHAKGPLLTRGEFAEHLSKGRLVVLDPNGLFENGLDFQGARGRAMEYLRDNGLETAVDIVSARDAGYRPLPMPIRSRDGDENEASSLPRHPGDNTTTATLEASGLLLKNYGLEVVETNTDADRWEQPKRFKQSYVVIGRGLSCDMRLRGSLVSEVHACLYAARGSLYLFDCRSKNGTYLEGRKLRPYVREKIAPGQLFWFGTPETITLRIVRVDGKDQ